MPAFLRISLSRVFYPGISIVRYHFRVLDHTFSSSVHGVSDEFDISRPSKPGTRDVLLVRVDTRMIVGFDRTDESIRSIEDSYRLHTLAVTTKSNNKQSKDSLPRQDIKSEANGSRSVKKVVYTRPQTRPGWTNLNPREQGK